MLVLHDPATLLHSTVEFLGAHLIPAKECPERITTIIKSLESHKHNIKHVQYDGKPGQSRITLQNLLKATHDDGYLDHLQTAHAKWVSKGVISEDGSVLPECFPIRGLFKNGNQAAKLSNPPKDEFARAGFYAFDMSAGITAYTWLSALASANLALEGVKILFDRPEESNRADRVIMALCRPPGHHCTTSIAGGYCYINNAVIAAKAFQKLKSSKTPNSHADPCIAILDIDFHHGNGTQEYFYEDGSVLYVSIHGEDAFPYYSGFEDETGAAAGKGYNLNLPLPARSSVDQYIEKLDVAMSRIITVGPQFLVVSLGLDTFNLDPLGSFKIFTEDYRTIASRISSKLSATVPVLILLEGGYVVEQLGNNVCSFLEGWEHPDSGST